MIKLLVNILAIFIPDKQKRKRFREHLYYSLWCLSLKLQDKNPTDNKTIVVHNDGTEVLKPHTKGIIKGLKIEFFGKNSIVKLYEPFSFKNCLLRLGNNNVVEIQKTDYHIEDFEIPKAMSDGSCLYIGKDCSTRYVRCFMHDEPNTKVYIGSRCMFSFEVIIWSSDGHSILDENGNAINKGEDIYIGNHVWVGMRTTILKGSYIPDNSILAAGSIFTKSSNPQIHPALAYKASSLPSPSITSNGSIFAGIPARQIKTNINWDRKNYYHFNKMREKNENK